MRYISGIHALNLPCSLETVGDWHRCSLRWENLKLWDSDDSIYKEYGIETCDRVPFHEGTFYIANTLRAILDLLETKQFGLAQGAEVFISNEAYNEEFFDKVCALKEKDYWKTVDEFMTKEYLTDWIKYKEKKHVQ